MPLARSALSILLLTGVGLGQAPDVEREALRRQLAEERARLREQEARLDALERQLDAGVRPAQAEDGGPDEAARPLRLGMFYVESADGAHRVELGGRLQVDGRFVLGRDPGDVDDGFQARRARVELRGHLWRRLSFDLDLEFGRTGDADLRNAYLNLALCSGLEVRAGQMLLPYSDERLTTSNALLHPERSILVGHMIGERDLGVMLHGALFGGVVDYALGAYNGEGENTSDTDDDLDLAARLELHPWADEDLVFSLNYVHSPTNLEHTGPADVRTVGDELTRFLDYADTNQSRGRRERLGGGVRLTLGAFTFGAEANLDYHRQVRTAAGARANLMHWGYRLDALWVLSGEALDQEQDGAYLTPEAPLYDPEGESWGPGAFALAARFETFYADPAAIGRGFATGTDAVHAATATLHWYAWRDVRTSLSYTYSHFQDGLRDASGDRAIDEHALIVRWAAFF